MECSKEKEIFDVATIMRHGLTLSRDDILTGNISDNYTPGLLEYFATSIKSEKSKLNESNVISDIFKPIKNSDGLTTVPKFILIEGAPGMGKTTLCKEIAYQWAKQSLLKDTKLLFLLHLRDLDISKIKMLKDLIPYLHVFDKGATELSEQCADIIIEREGEDLTILFDGYDEFNSLNDSLITDILNRATLPQCRIVVTSRHTASHKLHRKADVRVEVLGFNDLSKRQYIEQELRDFQNKTNELQSYLNDHESIKSICYIPMMMAILVYVFKEKGPIPNNLPDLYDKFVALTISHQLQRQKKSDDIFVSLQSLPKEYKNFVLSLSKFAFLILQTKKTVFNKEDINGLCPDLTRSSYDLDNLGIIKYVEYFSTDKGNTCAFNFLHLSIQEYLAAYYINSIDQCSQFSELESTFLNETFQGTWTMFMAMNTKSRLKFQNFSVYCKEAHYDSFKKWITDLESLLLVDCFIQLHDVVNSKVVSSDAMQILFSKDENNAAIASRQHFYLSLCSAEKTEVELFIIDRAIKDVFSSNWFKVCIRWLDYGYSTIFHTGHILILNKVNQQQMVDIFRSDISIEYMRFNHCHISESTIDAINLSCLQHILQFKVFNCSFEYNALSKLGNFLSSLSTLLGIRFHSCHFTTEQVDTICSIISSICNLEILELDNTGLHEDIMKIAKALEHVRTLKVLILANNNIPQSAVAAISHIVNLNKSLRVFNIEGNNFKSVEEIVKSLCVISSLQKLNLNNNEILVDSSETLASVILHNAGLQELHLCGNNLGESTLKVVKALQSIVSLKILVLENNRIPKESFSQLASALESSKGLEELWLSNNNLQSSAVVILQSLITISTIKSLNMNDNQITEEAGEALTSVILHNTGLEELHLSGNNLGKGLLNVMKATQHITSLRKLSLGNNNISIEVSNELASAIKVNKHLEVVELFSSNLKSSAITILQSLSTISTLKNLNINNNRITEEAGEALASVILRNTGLKELHLSDNDLGEGTIKVAKVLQQITSLRSLDFGNNNISKAAVSDLALAIKSNKHLKKLLLHDNNLHFSAISILESLSTISSLQFLNINNNQIGEAGGKVLALVIKNNKGLRQLYVRHNNIQNSVTKLSEVIKSITSIDTLDLGNNNLLEIPCDELAGSNNSSFTELQSHHTLQSSVTIMLNALTSTTKLRILNLYGNVITETAGDLLASLISWNFNLQLLCLNLLKKPLKVTEALQNLSSLQILVLDTCNLPEEANMNIASTITNNKSLK